MITDIAPGKESESFPAAYAQTINFSLGAPKAFRVSADGRKVYFLRAESPVDRHLALWVAEPVEDGDRKQHEEHWSERCVASVDQLLGLSSGKLKETDAERLRKERLREAASGITDYSISERGDHVAFALRGDIYIYLFNNGVAPKVIPVGDASTVELSPNGSFIAYVSNSQLFVLPTQSDAHPIQVSPDSSTNVSWGLPDFIGSEEMDRHEAYWWFPDSSGLVYLGSDVSEVEGWHLTSPLEPSESPSIIKFPRAGTFNAKLSAKIWRLGLNKSIDIKWSKDRYPYIVGLRWNGLSPSLAVQPRSQKCITLLGVDVATGKTREEYTRQDPCWIELSENTPGWTTDGKIVDLRDSARRELVVENQALTAPNLYVRRLCGQLDSGEIVFSASDDPTESHVWLVDAEGSSTRLTDAPGVFDAVVGGNTIVVFGTTLSKLPAVNAVIHIRNGAIYAKSTIANHAREIPLQIAPTFKKTKRSGINYALLLPEKYDGAVKLPILLDPYGGPMLQRCVKSSQSLSVSQWFANQGFAVIVADGRGTPGRDREWEKAVFGDLASPPLEDQIEVLEEYLSNDDHGDRNRVAIRGWSFGGYLASLAVIRRPDLFHVAVAGAPVADWSLYDTYYSERYLGEPRENRATYSANSLVVHAAKLTRPLLLIHGFGDDNVVSAHTFRFSEALFSAGREHYVLPLAGGTHMTSSPAIAESLLNAQLTFIRRIFNQ